MREFKLKEALSLVYVACFEGLAETRSTEIPEANGPYFCTSIEEDEVGEVAITLRLNGLRALTHLAKRQWVKYQGRHGGERTVGASTYLFRQPERESSAEFPGPIGKAFRVGRNSRLRGSNHTSCSLPRC